MKKLKEYLEKNRINHTWTYGRSEEKQFIVVDVTEKERLSELNEFEFEFNSTEDSIIAVIYL